MQSRRSSSWSSTSSKATRLCAASSIFRRSAALRLFRTPTTARSLPWPSLEGCWSTSGAACSLSACSSSAGSALLRCQCSRPAQRNCNDPRLFQPCAGTHTRLTSGVRDSACGDEL
eukprot:2953506-Rhodomonas_salina.1